ncbi:hypothetical protein [Actinomycetospora lemnae]|uniref:Uncharacterized protein n=1 Tax=Actinomycetospora lemnae TaxID=3019891 RepID=A0ABT5SSS2_9PSEU|nr:hypothetical protein [Actinomycetospora sp. DW7H6]MDD7965890.1 hypothetical protein [Actinomycetospora sp. DW7H6]
MYELNAPINAARMKTVATGYSQQLERWEDGPTGRRSTGLPLLDDATGAPITIHDVMLPTGRDGRLELHGVRVIGHEVPDLEPYTEVELEDLNARVRPARNGAKGIEVSFSASAIRPATGTDSRSARKHTGDETAAA